MSLRGWLTTYALVFLLFVIFFLGGRLVNDSQPLEGLKNGKILNKNAHFSFG